MSSSPSPRASSSSMYHEVNKNVKEGANHIRSWRRSMNQKNGSIDMTIAGKYKGRRCGMFESFNAARGGATRRRVWSRYGAGAEGGSVRGSWIGWLFRYLWEWEDFGWENRYVSGRTEVAPWFSICNLRLRQPAWSVSMLFLSSPISLRGNITPRSFNKPHNGAIIGRVLSG